MTRKQALMAHLLSGGVLSIKTAYKYFGVSNIAREVGRLIERPLNIQLKREEKTGRTKYGSSCHWLEYSATGSNKKVIRKALLELVGRK